MKQFKFSSLLNVLLSVSLLLGFASCQKNQDGEPSQELLNPDKVVSVSYCSDVISDGIGMATQGTYGAAAQMPVSMLKASGTHIVAVRVGIMESATNCSVFVSKGLNQDPISSKGFTAVVGAWTYILLDSPIYIEGEEDYYIGYTMTSSGYCIGVESKSVSSALDYVNAGGSWSTMKSNNLSGYVSVQAMVAGGSYDDKIDIAISNLTGDKYVKINSMNDFSCVITNTGNNAIEGFKVSYTYGETEKDSSVSNKLMPGETFLYQISNCVAPSTVGSITLAMSVSIDKEESVNTNNSVSMEQLVYEESYPRVLMVEQFTGQGCTYCPDGTTYMKNVLDSRSDEVVWAAHHYGYTEDALSVAKSQSYLAFGVTGAPSMMIDRTKIDALGTTGAAFHPAYISNSIVNEMLAIPSFVRLNLERTFDEESRELTVVVSGDFLLSMPNARMNVFVVQDSIIAAQTNGSSNYAHNHTVRAILSDTWGDTFEVAEDGTFSVEYSYILPDSIYSIATTSAYANKAFATVPEHMEVQVFVTDYNSSTTDRKVQNAAKISFKEND